MARNEEDSLYGLELVRNYLKVSFAVAGGGVGGFDHQSLGALKLSKVAHTVFQSKGLMAFSEICKGVHDLKKKKKRWDRGGRKDFPIY